MDSLKYGPSQHNVLGIIFFHEILGSTSGWVTNNISFEDFLYCVRLLHCVMKLVLSVVLQILSAVSLFVWQNAVASHKIQAYKAYEHLLVVQFSGHLLCPLLVGSEKSLLKKTFPMFMLLLIAGRSLQD